MAISSTKNTWDDFLTGWPYSLFGTVYFQFQIIRYMQREYPPPIKILEVGCGRGQLSVLLSDLGYNVTASDIDEQLLKQLQSQCSVRPNLTTKKASLFELPYRDSAFDVVISQGVMDHFDEENVIKGIKEQLRVGRSVIVDVPNKRSKQNFGDERLFSNRKWKYLIQEAGGTLRDFLGRDRVSSAVEFLRPSSGRLPFVSFYWWKHVSKTSMFVISQKEC